MGAILEEKGLGVGLRRDYAPLLRSATWNYLGYFFDAAVSLALVAYVVRWVGVAEYGVYLFALSLAGQFGLLNFGLPNLLSQAYIAERSRTGASGVSRLLSTAFTFSSLLGMAALGICLGCAALLPGPFRIPPGLVPLAKQALALGGAWIFLAIPTKSLDLAVESWHRFDTLNKVQILVGSLRAIVTVALLREGFGILALMWIQVALAALRLVLLVVLIPGQMKGVRVNPLLWDWPLLRPVLRSAGWASLDDVVWQLGMGMDTLIVSVLVSMHGVAIYGVGSKAAVQLISLLRRGLNVVFPALAERHTAADSESLRGLYVASTRAGLAVLLPITLALTVFANTVVQVWVGPQYQGAATVMRWLLVGALIEALAAPANYLLYACGRVSTAARIALAENALNFGLSCLLVLPFGAAGPAVGTAVAHTLGTLGGFVVAACRVAQLAPRRLASLLMRDNGVPTLISFLGLSLAWYGSRGSDPLLRLFFGALFGPLLYFAARLARMESVPRKSGTRAVEKSALAGRDALSIEDHQRGTRG